MGGPCVPASAVLAADGCMAPARQTECGETRAACVARAGVSVCGPREGGQDGVDCNLFAEETERSTPGLGLAEQPQKKKNQADVRHDSA